MSVINGSEKQDETRSSVATTLKIETKLKKAKADFGHRCTEPST
jgi:hypothetical protein